MPRLLALAALLFAFPAHAYVGIHWVTVGDPGNACEVQPASPEMPGGCFGSVSETYRISKYEITNAQYAEFLDAVAKTDTHGLWNLAMGQGFEVSRTGDEGSYVYGTFAPTANQPVNFVSFWDALRFANWLHNGQPTGGQDNTTTENGAYTITSQGINDNSITRNAGARVFLTSEDEWYKAAYYDAGSMSYNPYPFADGFDGAVCEVPPGTTSHSANCGSIGSFPNDHRDVGAYSASASPNRTFDQGGNVSEWNEAIVGDRRGQRGGSWGSSASDLAASYREGNGTLVESRTVGFRLASLVPPVPSLGPTGLLLVAAGLLGVSAYLRRRA